ncbi:MAG: hypothetical protein HOP19_28325 [Acidobacteria bacterium]|nr:hypothetical protein [Acidobacteriota bacterium]
MLEPPQLIFREIISYPHDRRGITLRVIVSSGGIAREATAKLDPGAGVSLFSREIGEQLELDIEAGDPLRLDSLALGGIDCFGHEVTLHVGNQVTSRHLFCQAIWFAAQFSRPARLDVADGRRHRPLRKQALSETLR